jgi:hypothetical protein
MELMPLQTRRMARMRTSWRGVVTNAGTQSSGQKMAKYSSDCAAPALRLLVSGWKIISARQIITPDIHPYAG